jgi:hypothetical protein
VSGAMCRGKDWDVTARPALDVTEGMGRHQAAMYT